MILLFACSGKEKKCLELSKKINDTDASLTFAYTSQDAKTIKENVSKAKMSIKEVIENCGPDKCDCNVAAFDADLAKRFIDEADSANDPIKINFFIDEAQKSLKKAFDDADNCSKK